jgi:hypothetical protein
MSLVRMNSDLPGVVPFWLLFDYTPAILSLATLATLAFLISLIVVEISLTTTGDWNILPIFG